MAESPLEESGTVESPGWAEKTAFVVGLPEDPDAIPTMRYQSLLGRVYVTKRWRDGSVARGEVTLADLEALVGGPVREGWYDEMGSYLGAMPPLDEEDERS
jgi:hypothetical protein